MRRREFILALGSAAAWPLAARAQQGERVRRIGILMPFLPTNAEMQARVRVFRDELRKRGWAAGVNVQFDERWTADNMDVIRSAATNLVELNPDAIVAIGARVIPILMELTRSIPIVTPSGADPVGYGYAESLAHPGRNVTGFATMEPSVVSKMLQTLKEIAPTVSHISMIYNPENRLGSLFVRLFESAAGSLSFKSTVAQIHGLADIESAIAAAAAQPNGGIFVPLDLSMLAFVEQTVEMVARHRLPAVYGNPPVSTATPVRKGEEARDRRLAGRRRSVSGSRCHPQ
jgi:putative tryptophan/tyrosine transport system substrate-binding protein